MEDEDEEKYDLSRSAGGGPSDFDRAMMVQSSGGDDEVSSAKPSWAAQYEAKKAEEAKRKPTRLKGTCAKWGKGARADHTGRTRRSHQPHTRRLTLQCTHAAGWGFIKVPGQADMYVNQRNIVKKGFRSLLEGEPVEFEIGKMADGKLEALNVTGPDGAEPEGQMHPDDKEEMEKASLKAKAEKEPRPKPYTAFVPRTVKRPAAKPVAKPKPPAPAPAPAPPAEG